MDQKIDQTAKLEYETERGTFSRSFLQYLICFSICKGEQETAGKAEEKRKSREQRPYLKNSDISTSRYPAMAISSEAYTFARSCSSL